MFATIKHRSRNSCPIVAVRRVHSTLVRGANNDCCLSSGASRSLQFIFAGLALVVAVAGTQESRGAEGERPVISTTIDFLDYCFSRTDPSKGYFTLEQYDEVIRTVAESGITKIYLRVDVCGLTLYPTKVGKQYAGDGRDPGSTNLVNTLKRYDPAAKTIELGHRHGLEVWAWDTLFDDEATMVYYGAEAEPDLSRRFGEYPLKDPFMVENPQFQWRLDPRIEARQQEEAAARGPDVPITAIRITSDTRSATNRVTAEMFEILVSTDNRRYRVHEGDWEFRVESAKPPVLVIEGLKIAEPFIKLAFHKPWPEEQGFTITGEADGFAQVLYGGTWHKTLCDYRKQIKPPRQGGFDFVTSRFAWDYGRRVLGIAKHVPHLPRHYGIVELACPEVRAHKLAKLRELAAYDFDGFAYSIRTHTLGRVPQNYGYNEATRNAFQERYGKDIWTEGFDREAWLGLRAEAVNAYLAEAGKTLGPRPLYMDFPRQEPGAPYIRAYGGMPFQADAWVRDRAVAGVRMLGIAPDREVEPEFAGADGVRIVRFVDNGRMPPPDKFRENLKRWVKNPVVDEIEFYETLLYTDRPEYLRIIREVLGE